MWPFKPASSPAPVRRTIDAEVEDLLVTFFLKASNKHPRKQFAGCAFYSPNSSQREDGLFVYAPDDLLSNFMHFWQERRYAIIGDMIVRFEDFDRAEIERSKRIVRV